jgi:hypothetical protein
MAEARPLPATAVMIRTKQITPIEYLAKANAPLVTSKPLIQSKPLMSRPEPVRKCVLAKTAPANSAPQHIEKIAATTHSIGNAFKRIFILTKTSVIALPNRRNFLPTSLYRIHHLSIKPHRAIS